MYFEEQVFEVCNPDCFEYSAIVTAELWTERVMIYFVVNEPGAWGHPNNVQSMVIDTGVGQCFEVICQFLILRKKCNLPPLCVNNKLVVNLSEAQKIFIYIYYRIHNRKTLF